MLDIYQSCRSTEEIGRAFDALREDLEHRIDRRMTEARSLLLERFDGEVRRRLRLAGEEAEQAVDRRRRSSRDFARSVLGRPASASQVTRAAGAVRAAPLDGVHWLQLDAAALPARLARLAGSEGWWFVYRFETGGLLPEERLVHLVLLRDRDGFRALPLEDGELLARLPAREEQPRPPAAVSVAARSRTRAGSRPRDAAPRGGAAEPGRARPAARAVPPVHRGLPARAPRGRRTGPWGVGGGAHAPRRGGRTHRAGEGPGRQRSGPSASTAAGWPSYAPRRRPATPAKDRTLADLGDARPGERAAGAGRAPPTLWLA